MNTQTTEQELAEAIESQQQIIKAWQDGDYDHDYFLYERDIRNADKTVANLQEKMDAENASN